MRSARRCGPGWEACSGGAGAAAAFGDTSMNLGLYGTLLDPEVRALVFGEAWRDAVRPARLDGWGRYYVAGEKYPGIRRQAGSAIDVLVVEALLPQALAAADAFEGAKYTRQTLAVVFTDPAGGGSRAMFYVPRPAIRLSADEWRYDDAWRQRHRDAFLAEARAAVAGSGTVVREPGRV